MRIDGPDEQPRLDSALLVVSLISLVTCASAISGRYWALERVEPLIRSWRPVVCEMCMLNIEVCRPMAMHLAISDRGMISDSQTIKSSVICSCSCSMVSTVGRASALATRRGTRVRKREVARQTRRLMPASQHRSLKQMYMPEI